MPTRPAWHQILAARNRKRSRAVDSRVCFISVASAVTRTVTRSDVWAPEDHFQKMAKSTSRQVTRSSEALLRQVVDRLFSELPELGSARCPVSPRSDSYLSATPQR